MVIVIVVLHLVGVAREMSIQACSINLLVNVMLIIRIYSQKIEMICAHSLMIWV